MKTNFTLLTKLIVSLFVILLANSTKLSGQNTYDGNYCPGPGQVGDEYNTGIVFNQLVNANASSTCEIFKIWAKVDTQNQELRLGLKIGNSGAALFRLYIDTDNNASTGLLQDQFGGTLAVSGAEYILELNAKSNSTFTLYSGNGTTKTVINGLILVQLMEVPMDAPIVMVSF